MISDTIKPNITRSLLSYSFVLLLLTTGLGTGPQSDLKYQDRGNRYEGVRGLPISNKIDLISAMVDYREELNQTPDQLKLRFYLGEQTPVFVRVREQSDLHNYWMDRLKPASGWRPGFANEFQWSTQEVIKPLNLRLDDLGAIAQLDSDDNSTDIRVAPILLYYSQLPNSITGYSFSFRVSRKASVTCSFSRDNAGSNTLSQQSFEMPGQRTRTIRWTASDAVDGWYRLTIRVEYSNNGEKLNQVVRFYHHRGIEDAPGKLTKPEVREVPQAQTADASGIFSTPVKLTKAQKEFLASSAERVRQREESLKSRLAKVEPTGSLTELKQLLLSALSVSRQEITSDQETFTSRIRPIRLVLPPRADSDTEAAKMFFGEILARYDVEIEMVKKVEQKDYSLARDRTLKLLDTNREVYVAVTTDGDLTLNLEVTSSPQGAKISYKRKGDENYTSEGNQTSATLLNLGYAIWFVRVELEGFKPQEKSHDPFRESNHVLTFELQPLSKNPTLR